jgi:gliding motility-associated-like protein
MSKYILAFILLISLTTAAQEQPLPVNNISKKTTWDEQEKFVNGFARVLKNNQFSFINKSGLLIHALEFDGARNFNNQLAAVKKGDKWGFINQSGELVIPFKYDIAFDFTETVTGVLYNKNWWLINTKGNNIAALDITAFYGFKNGIAKINKHDRWGTINTKAEIIFEKNQNNLVQKNAVQNPYAPAPVNNAITVCPDNIDFEYGNFFNWKCYTGVVDSIVNVNVITLNPSPPTPNRHTLYNRVMPSAIDPYGLFPTNPPDGSNFALRLGNTIIGGEAEGVSYTIHVPTNDSNFSIKYDYAVVFEDPGHTIWSQPRFQVKVFDSAANAYVDCASFEYVSTSNLPGFTRSTVDTGVIYKPWSSVFLSLRGYAGKTMYLEFKNADCVRKGHWGYSYIDVEKPCGQSVEMQYDCAAPHITTLNAPPGFQIYNWWDSAFTTILASGQQVTLNPGPAMNTTIWLEMIPFNNFGCLDTIPVKFTGEFTAAFDMSDTVGICAPHTFTFYNRDLPSTTAIWDFGDGTTGTGDTVTHTYNLPGNYLVKLNVTQPGGCFGAAIKLVSVVQPAGSFSFASGNYCDTLTVRFDAITSYTDSLFWDFGDGTTLSTIQSSVTHTYATGGIFYPSLIIKSQGGCQTPVPATDSIKIDVIRTGFLNNQNRICGSTTVNFTDTSSAYFGIASRQWNFGDGTTGSGTNVSHTYTASGTYTVTLQIVGVSGCRGNISIPIFVQVNDVPVAAITGPIEECLFVPVTFNTSVQSVDPIGYSHWTCSNGFNGSGGPFTISFTQPGTYTFEFITRTVNGCADTAVHSIIIHPMPDVQQPPSQILCNGDFTSPVNFSGTIAGTVFNWTNSNASIGLAASGSGNIASFQAVYTGNSVANAGIRVTPVANGCSGQQKIFAITIYPTPNVVQPASQTLCNGSNTAAIVFSGTVNNTIYNWTNNNPAIGLAASGTGDIPSFTVTGNGVATIIVRPVVNGCPGAAKTFSITVNPMPDVVQVANQTLCNGSNTAAIIFSGAVSGTTYNWTNSNPSIGLAANGAGNIPSFTVIGNSSNTTTAVITVSPTINGCPGSPKFFTITINPVPTVVQPANQNLCSGSSTSAILFSGTVNGTVYNWTNNNTSIGLAASGSGDIASFIAIANTTNNTASITVSPASNGCPGAAKTFTIIATPIPAVAQPADQTLCNGSLSTAINFSGPVAGTIYNWTNSNPSIGLAANGAGNIPSFTVTGNISNTITAVITVSPTINGCPGTPKSFTLTVNPVSTVAQPADQNLCSGSNTSAILFSGAVNATVYNWTNNNTSIGLAASGTGDIASFIATANATNNTATITVSPMANGCPGTSKTFTIVAKPIPAVAQPADQNLCNGSSTTAINFSGPVAGTVYSWTNSNPSIGLAASGNGDIASFMASTNGTNTSVATITVSPSANGCSAPAKTFTITVYPVSDVMQPPSQAVCNGAIINATAFTGTIPGAIFNWTNSNTAIGLPANGTGNINSFTAVNNTAVPIVATITVAAASTTCSAPAKTFQLTIHPTPAVVAGNDGIVCLGKTVQLSVAGAAQYTWTPATNLSCTGCNNPVATPTDSIIYRVKGTSGFGCPAFDSVVLNVIKPFKMQVSPNDTLCIGETTGLAAYKANSYLWSPPTGLSSITSATPIARIGSTTNYRVIGFDGHNCFTDTGYVTITVGPKPSVTLGPDKTLATGTILVLNAITANGPIISWMWTPAGDLSCNNCPKTSTIVKNNSFYSVLVTNIFGCVATDTIFINSMCKSAQVFIPNAFTPDGDGLNDVAMIRGSGVTIKSFRIFNRWGELVFEKENFYPNELKYGWDGKVRGVPATPDVFVYTAEVFCDNGIPFTYKGNITLLK